MSKQHEVSYPSKPDARGTAKKYYDRRAFYFGKHNTPESHMLFALWKKRLIETGEPPEVRTLRAELSHLTSGSSQDEELQAQPEVLDVEVHSVLRRSHAMPLAIALSAVLISASIIGRSALDAYRFHLTDEEKSVVLGHRMYRDHLRKSQQENDGDLRDEIRKLLMERDEPISPEFHEKMKDAIRQVSREP